MAGEAPCEIDDENQGRPTSVLMPVCGKLGDERLMLRVGPMECLAHDRCVFSTDNAVAAAAIKA